MPVMKFGGSSVADADRIRGVGDIIIARSKKESPPPVVVVSAMKGVTDTLLRAARSAESGKREYKEAIYELKG